MDDVGRRKRLVIRRRAGSAPRLLERAPRPAPRAGLITPAAAAAGPAGEAPWQPIFRAVNFAAGRFLASGSWQESLPEALAHLGEAYRTSRAFVFETVRDINGTWLCRRVAAWGAPDRGRRSREQQGRRSRVQREASRSDERETLGLFDSSSVFALRANGFGRWEDEMSRGHPIAGPVSAFPSPEREALQTMGAKSIATVPVFAGNTWWGFIGLVDLEDGPAGIDGAGTLPADPDRAGMLPAARGIFDPAARGTFGRDWTPAEIDALKVSAAILGAVIQRQQAEETINRLYESERIQRQNAQALRDAGASFSANLSFDGLLDQILDELPRIVPYDAAYLLLSTCGLTFEPFGALAQAAPSRPKAPSGSRSIPAPSGSTGLEDGRELPQKAVVARQRGYIDRNDGHAPWFPGRAFELSQTPTLRWMAEQCQPLVVSDTRSASGLLHLDEQGRFGSWAGAPIVVQGQVAAFFALEKVEPGFYRAEHAALLGLYAAQAGLALQNARLFTEALGALEREANLNQVTWAISSNLDLSSILKNIVRLATELSQADACALAILDPEGVELSYPYLLNLPVSLSKLTEPRGRGLAWKVIEDRKSILLPDYGQYPDAIPAWVEAGVHALISVPLIAGEACLGCLGLFSYNLDKRFSPRDQALMESVGRQAGIAIQNARLFEASQRRAREAETLRLALREVTSALDFDRVLSKILKHLRNVVPYDSAVVFLTEGERVRAVAGRGLPVDNTVINHTFSADNLLLAEVRRMSDRPLILVDAQADPRYEGWGGVTHTRGWMGLPLRAHGDLIGYLTVDSKKVGAYGPQDASLVQAFADEVAIAIFNARLFRQVQHLAITDSLTGLHNRRYFFEMARMEMDRARRYGRPLALIMLDIDHFKLVNDTYGHQAGDRVLVTVAARCLDTLRGVDLSARYGGEEFVFLLPETEMERARQVAGRLQSSLNDQPIDAGEAQISISVSLGLAEMGPDCPDLQMLIRRADQALYLTKETGRGRITVWAAEMGVRR